MHLLALAFVLAATAASPTPPAASPVPSPAALAPTAPPIKPVQWQGVTLGEDIDTVRARLGKPAWNRKVILGSMLVEYPIHGGEGSLLLETTEKQVTQIRVEAAAPKELGLPIGDPFGVNLGDSLTRLIVVRGGATRSDEDAPDESTSTYGTSNENRWVYSIRAGTIYAITLVAPKPPPPPSGPAHPGLVLRGTPPPKHVVIKSPPVATPSASASAASHGATASSTPTPGVALSTPTPGVALATPTPGIVLPTPTPKPTPVPAGTVITSGAVAAAATPSSAPQPSAAPSASSSPIAVKPSGLPTPTVTPNAGASPNAGATPNPNVALAPDGSSPETAIPVRAPDMATGFDYIYKFIENIACGDSGQYRVTGQDLFSQQRHNYAKVTAECSTTHDKRAFFFDITYIFAKSER